MYIVTRNLVLTLYVRLTYDITRYQYQTDPLYLLYQLPLY